jgi:hypothetical protein
MVSCSLPPIHESADDLKERFLAEDDPKKKQRLHIWTTSKNSW